MGAGRTELLESLFGAAPNPPSGDHSFEWPSGCTAFSVGSQAIGNRVGDRRSETPWALP